MIGREFKSLPIFIFRTFHRFSSLFMLYDVQKRAGIYCGISYAIISIMASIWEIVRNRFFILNFIICYIAIVTLTKFELFTKAFSKLLELKGFGLSLFIIPGFSVLYFVVVTYDFILLALVNYWFNKFSNKKNVIFHYYSGLLLLPHLLFIIIKEKYDFDTFESMIFSSVSTGFLFLIYCPSSLKSFKTWLLSILTFILSTVWFTILGGSQILLLALLAKWLFDLKNLIF